MELKDHNASKGTKQQFEELKAKYPEVFSINNEDISHETLRPWNGLESSKGASASPFVVVPKKSAPGGPPRHRMCIDFRKLNELQPEVCHADSETGGIISLVPLPKLMRCMVDYKVLKSSLH